MQIDVGELVYRVFDQLLSFWFLWLFIFLLGISIWLIKRMEKGFDGWVLRRRFKKGESWRNGRQLIDWLKGLKPSEFEDYIAHLFKNLGFEVQVTGGAYDGGIDVVAIKHGQKHFIQCKKFITQQVPVGAVRDFYGAMVGRAAGAKGFFITTNKFTLEAEKFAEDKPLELIDGLKLAKYIEMAKVDYVEKVIDRPIVCPNCGSAMVLRKGKFGEFYGCVRYPQCKGTRAT